MEKKNQYNFPKVVIIGPEGSGKTTLAKQLSEHYRVPSRSDWHHDYIGSNNSHTISSISVVDLTGLLQLTEEIDSRIKTISNTINIIEHDAFSLTNLYQNVELKEIKTVRSSKHTLYILLDIDFPYIPKGTHVLDKSREEQLEILEQKLAEDNASYIKLPGDITLRFQKSREIIDTYLELKDYDLLWKDVLSIIHRGITTSLIKTQIEAIKKGATPVALHRAAKLGDGIHGLNTDEADFYAAIYEKNAHRLEVLKFVPASGAATRMFKFLIEFLMNFNPEKDCINQYINNPENTEFSKFISAFDKFPFFKALKNYTINTVEGFQKMPYDQRTYILIKTLIEDPEFNFANKPKGVIPFHRYDNYTATAFEEQLKESIAYNTNSKQVNIEFTVSNEHLNYFKNIENDILRIIEERKDVQLNIHYSYQNKSTDSIALTSTNKIFRDSDGNIIFRPAGHGALLENLNKIDADLVFIKNIDNVSQNNFDDIVRYKKALAGILLKKQENIFHYLNILDGNNTDPYQIREVVNFIEKDLQFSINEDFQKYTLENQINYLHNLLNRPIRVCGMVRNQGEPGGGPFWVHNKRGYVFLQIVESSQIDLNNPSQKEIFKESTHFNPVDIVAGLRNYKGEKFDLREFVDQSTGFVVQKSYRGKELKSYELPGLWNGAMSKWLTFFCEVPLSTFSPVKTINDLLKHAHQPEAF